MEVKMKRFLVLIACLAALPALAQSSHKVVTLKQAYEDAPLMLWQPVTVRNVQISNFTSSGFADVSDGTFSTRIEVNSAFFPDRGKTQAFCGGIVRSARKECRGVLEFNVPPQRGDELGRHVITGARFEPEG
jgi:hypothetical protein